MDDITPTLTSQRLGRQLFLDSTRKVVDQFQDYCKDWSWNQVFAFMVLNKGYVFCHSKLKTKIKLKHMEEKDKKVGGKFEHLGRNQMLK